MKNGGSNPPAPGNRCVGPPGGLSCRPGGSFFAYPAHRESGVSSRMVLVPLLATGAGLGVWAYATYEPNSPLFGRSIGRGPRGRRAAYLTFDDGPNAAATEAILDTLAADRVPAAFFMVANTCGASPASRAAWSRRGTRGGNRTHWHSS